jgi:membrane protease YdiL (CAAX protease family)
VLLHLAPGAALLAFAVATGPLWRAAGLPPVWGLLVGTLVVVVPVELGLVLRAVRRRGERPSAAALGLRPLRRADLAPLLLTAAACLLAPAAVVWLEPALRALTDGWLPGGFTAGTTGLAGHPPAVRAATLALWVVALVVVGPLVEEVYFRGWLLPRLPGGALPAATAGAALFAAYHLWQPHAWLTILVFALPLALLARTRGAVTGCALVHGAVNLLAFAALLAGVVQR